MSKFVSGLYLVLILMLMVAVGFLGMQVSQLNEKLAMSQQRHQRVKVSSDQVGKEMDSLRQDIDKQQSVLKEFASELTQVTLDIKSLASKKYMSPIHVSVDYPLFKVEEDSANSVIHSKGYIKRINHWFSVNEPFMDYIVKKSLPLEYDRNIQNVVVQDMIVGSIFNQMGLKKGDGILAINGKRMLKGADIRTELMEQKPSKISIVRDGKRLTLDVEYVESSNQDVALNLSKSEFSDQINKIEMSADTEAVVEDGQMVGVKIVDLQPESILNTMSLKKEDVITHINGQPVTNKDLVSSLKTSDTDTLQIDVLRGDKPDSVFVTIQD